jgi:hypothetical protein
MSNRTDLTDALKDQWLDAGLLDLASRIRIRQLETRDSSKTFTIGSNEVSFPTSMVAALDIRNTTSDLPLDYIEWPRFRQLKITAGIPRQWTVYGAVILLDHASTTSDALSIFGVSQPTWAAGPTATPGIDDQLEYGIELLAAAHAFRDTSQERKAALIENPDSPGTGQFWTWVRANKLPTLLQGFGSRTGRGIPVIMTGYEVVT